MRYFCVSDLHGNYDALQSAITSSGYDHENPDHQLISLGDEFGRSERGLGSKGVYEYLTNKKFFYNKPVVIRGNHQQIFLDILKRKYLTFTDIHNGELETFASLTGISKESFLGYVDPKCFQKLFKLPKLLEVASWIKDNPFFFQTKEHYLFHGWCPKKNGAIDPNPSIASAQRWWNATWANTEKEINLFSAVYPNGYGKTLVFGHWGTHLLRERFDDGKNKYYSIWEDKQHKLVGIDQTTYYNTKIEMYTFEDDPL